MGSSKETTTTNTTSQATATPEEQELNRLEIERIKATQPGLIASQQAGLDLINMLLTGQGPLPGFFGDLAQGISPDVTNSIVQRSLQDISPMFQSSGILDSGTAASLSSRLAGDIRQGAEEFNIGNKYNLLNLALTGQAQVQQPLLAQSANIGGRLAGLRPMTSMGTSVQRSPNPFLQSFQQSAGQFIGSGGNFSWGF